MSNPLTCLHRILGIGVREADKGYEGFLWCVSCDLEQDQEKFFKGKLYEYDIDSNVWVYAGRQSGMRAT